ncbi:hypothetical protein GCK72_001887 [Caenorhabditis remanei]|uniref:Uncharacterized protein n=1 Tax=Caenorhabditis remanei TaxID=31234 RepID=A0A6A5HQU7_CAERE|nr:hypothetical protein GCK72_001887 [Caenorhabditis remanei]KAF1770069.1 hypothetical protein GCK72_001887 [Caenorhabditis remanei]
MKDQELVELKLEEFEFRLELSLLEMIVKWENNGNPNKTKDNFDKNTNYADDDDPSGSDEGPASEDVVASGAAGAENADDVAAPGADGVPVSLSRSLSRLLGGGIGAAGGPEDGFGPPGAEDAPDDVADGIVICMTGGPGVGVGPMD